MINEDYGSASSDGVSAQEARESGSILNFLVAKKIGSSMWVMRCYMLFLTVQFLFFSNAFPMDHYFQRIMLANAVICCLRIHQRVPVFHFSRAHFAKCLQEDSAHYLIFSFVFLISKSLTLALLPTCLFALLHACNFTRQMFDCHGPHSWFFLRKLINAVARHQTNLFRCIALTEIFLMPTIIFMFFTGKSHPIAPFLYYKFLQYRYLSKRNPYSRLVFYELRIAAFQTMKHPSCPGPLTWIIGKIITLCCKLGPRLPYQE